jgi:hypothetical protein
MLQTLVETAAEPIAESTHHASRAGDAVADAIKHGVGLVRRATRRSGDAAEEFLDDITQHLLRRPVLIVVDDVGRSLRRGTHSLDDETKVDRASVTPRTVFYFHFKDRLCSSVAGQLPS